MSHTPYIEAQRLRCRDYKLDLGVGKTSEGDASIDKKGAWGGGRKCISDGSVSLRERHGIEDLVAKP